MKIKCLGGFREVGKNAVLIESKENVLFDYGIEVETGKLPLPLKKVDMVILSHAHLDHSGSIPVIYRKFRPPIYSTIATFELSHLLLKDSMKVARYRRLPKHFGKNDIKKMKRYEVKVTYGQRIDSENFSLDIFDAGHIPGCLTGDTLIQMASGDIEFISNIARKSNVLCINKSGKTSKSSALLWRKKSPGKIYLIKTRTSEILATKDHNLFTLDNNLRLKHIKVGDLKIGDFIISVKRINFNGNIQKITKIPKSKRALKIKTPKTATPELCQLLGYFVGDGHVSNKKVSFFDENLKVIRNYQNLLKSIFEVKPLIKKVKNCYILNVFSRNLAKFFISMNLRKKSPKCEIPKIVLRSPNKHIARFIKGLFDAEGYILKDCIGITTFSKKLILQLKLLLLRFGITSHFRTKMSKSKLVFSKNKCYTLLIWDPKSIRIFKEKIGFSHPVKNKKLRILSKKVGKSRRKSKIDIFPNISNLLRELCETYKKKGRKLNLRISRDEFPVTIKHFYEGHPPSRESLDKIVKLLETKLHRLESINFSIIDCWSKIKKVREIINLGQTELAKRMGISPAAVSKYEKNNNKKNLDLAIRTIEKIRDKIIENTKSRVQLLRILINSDIFFDKIVDIKEIRYNGFVYDLEVNQHHNFIANGVVSHNSMAPLLEIENKKILYVCDFNLNSTRLLNGARINAKDVDILIIESTYAMKNHPPRRETEKKFFEIIEETIANEGIAVIPCFAVGRSAEVLMILDSFNPDFPIYLDGMSKTATEITLKYPEFLRDARTLKRVLNNVTQVWNGRLRKKIVKEPCAIVASSGMLEGGPSVSYIKYLYNHPESSVIFTGFLIPRTAGRRLVETGRFVTEGFDLKIKMGIYQFDLSAHSGRDDLFNFVNKINPEKVICLHGDHCETFAKELKEKGFDAIAPKNGDIIDID